MYDSSKDLSSSGMSPSSSIPKICLTSSSGKSPKPLGFRDIALASIGVRRAALTITKDGTAVGTVRVYRGYLTREWLANQRVFVTRMKGQDYVLKCISKVNKYPVSGKEESIALSLKHKYILEVFGVVRHRDLTFLASKVVGNGTLSDALKSHDASLRSKELLHKYTLQVLEALVYLHDTKKLAHGDLKADNVLIDSDLDVKLCDFGLTTTVIKNPNDEKTSPYLRSSGNFRFLAVEHLMRRLGIPNASSSLLNVDVEDEQEVPGKKPPSDMWSFGCLLFHIYSGQVPWPMLTTELPKDDIRLLPQFVWEGDRPALPYDFVSDSFFNMAHWRYCHDCWEHLPRRRPTASMLLARLEAPQILPSPVVLRDYDAIQALVENEVYDMTAEFPENAQEYQMGDDNEVLLQNVWCPTEANGGIIPCYLKRYDGVPLRDGWSERLLRDMLIWRQIGHQNVLRLLGRCQVAGIWHAVYDSNFMPFKKFMQDYDADHPPGTRRRNVPIFQMASVFLRYNLPPPVAHNAVHIGSIWVNKARVNGSASALLHNTIYKGETVYACIANFSEVNSVRSRKPHGDVKAFGTLMRTVLSTRVDLATVSPEVRDLQILIEECETCGPYSAVNMRDVHIRLRLLLRQSVNGKNVI
ncbi:kinase-like protein [Exidia glandulosa HHB12029]|uniref:Kinase-like protein n=1 Tax=Exidia glandulosa HHB12029 TaxID=1314781 RepID=A0A165FBD6_EXIGL|nr:kinase-like protein [Exidia glandulosa HHB12029]